MHIEKFTSFLEKACFNPRVLRTGEMLCCLKRGGAGSSLSLKLMILMAFSGLAANRIKSSGGSSSPIKEIIVNMRINESEIK